MGLAGFFRVQTGRHFFHESLIITYICCVIVLGVTSLGLWRLQSRLRHRRHKVLLFLYFFFGIGLVLSAAYLGLHDEYGALLSLSYRTVRNELEIPMNTPHSTSPSRRVILGYYENGPTEHLERILSTLRQSGAQCDFVMVCTKDGLTPEYKAILKRYNARARTYVRLDVGVVTLSTLRFNIYRDFLLEHRQDYDYVMVTDVKDVMFQKDPFTIFDQYPKAKEGLVVAIEPSVNVIKLPGVNGEWISQCFGNAALHEVWGNRVTCSGTILGGLPPMLRYLDIVAQASKHSMWCGLHGTDQGVHNYVIYSRLSQDIKKQYVYHEDGPIATLSSATGLTFDTNGRLVNDDGKVYAIVHQMNRCWPSSLRDPASRYDCTYLNSPVYSEQHKKIYPDYIRQKLKKP